jgi:hydrogenase nickel incorporation protein HypB
MSKTIVLEKNVFEAIKTEGDELRDELKNKGIYLVNVMASPGGGKTTTLIQLINRLKADYRIGVMEADLDSDVDAIHVTEATGVKSLQIHTDELCYLDTEMIRDGLVGFEKEDAELVFIENVGNMVCPTNFDTGAHLNLCILSVPEGDDKPLNYPMMFQGCDLILINKIDTIEYFPFDFEKVQTFIKKINPEAAVFPISAKTGQGVEEVVRYLQTRIKNWRKN